MASINLGSFFGSFFGGQNWFGKPPNPLPPPLNLCDFSKPICFASISASSTPSAPDSPETSEQPKKPGKYRQMWDQYFWECENLPDYRHTPEVERILNQHPVLETRQDATPEEIEENKKWWEEFRSSHVYKFLKRTMEIDDAINEMELKENSEPYRREDRKLWQALPHVIGPDGRPIPRKAIKTKEESDDKFWDFARQFFFGLWGFRQRPYPPDKPIDVAQAIGYKRLEHRYYDCESYSFKL